MALRTKNVPYLDLEKKNTLWIMDEKAISILDDNGQVHNIGKERNVGLRKGIGEVQAKIYNFFCFDICYSPIFHLSKMGSYLTQTLSGMSRAYFLNLYSFTPLPL